MRYFFIVFILIQSINPVFSQITTVGSGSYTNTFPGVDSGNRNGYPNFSPQLSGAAQHKPIPTNDKFFVDTEGAVFVEVFDISGKKLQASNDKEQDISALSPGVYFVKVNRLDTANHQLIKILKK